ncbi:hypothetical protein [uncultured Georgenia sp.]|uniref:hypothetical protein n=1 Tax=uncultured Georgenia sp. TaxID=378209 RepID=UPI0026216FE8|nr:hypothetical protein [uncultured Georgenia sp.]HLV03083.1 hypothetical protein [Actinomycetaceae bacterium]
MTATATGERFWVPTPPGYVEIAAFDTDERAERHWRDMVEPVRTHLGDGRTDTLYAGLRAAREAMAGSRVTSAGVVLTAVDDEPAVWTFSTMVERVAAGPLNPVALVERALGHTGQVDSAEDITLVDGRSAVQAFVTLSPRTLLGRAHGSPAHVSDAAPPGLPAQLPVERLAGCVVAVSLPRRPHHLVVVTGSSQRREHRPLLAHVVSAVAAGVHVGSEEPQGVARAAGVLPVTDLEDRAG